MARIRIQDLTKTFRLDDAGSVSLFAKLHGAITGTQRRAEIRALEGVDLEVHAGEKLGVIGTNGSGKTTLMRLIAGIYTPTSGRLEVDGSIASFLQLGTGMIQRLTVRENVFLYGSVMGMTRPEILARFDEILDFAELAEFADVEVRRLSSGMMQRLSFAVAVQVDADVLLLDEILAVGDQHFRNKCYEYFESQRDSETTVVFSSHTLTEIETFCTRSVWLENGRVEQVGATPDVLRAYKDRHGYPLEEQQKANAGANAEDPPAGELVIEHHPVLEEAPEASLHEEPPHEEPDRSGSRSPSGSRNAENAHEPEREPEREPRR